MALLLFLLPSVKAVATPYIKDVMLFGSDSDPEDWLDIYEQKGWTRIDNDLNKGAGGHYIYLLYKRDSRDDGFNYGAITGFYIYSRTDSTLPPDTQTVGGRTYYLVPCAGDSDFVEGKGDLNEGCGENSEYIYLYYTRDAFPDNRVVTRITFNDTESGALGTNGDSDPYDLNEGAHGDYIYMHVITANTYDPVTVGNGTSSSCYLPLSMKFPYSLVQQLYTAEEIKTAGTIKAIAFYYRYTQQCTFDKQHIRVYLKQTGKSSLSGITMEAVSESNGYTTVYDGSFSASEEGWTYIQLDNPYEYDGDQNLIVCCYDYGSEAYSPYHLFSVHQAPDMAKIYHSDSSFNPEAERDIAMFTENRPNIRFNIVPAPYPKPIRLSVTRTEYTANVSWSAPAGTNAAISGYEWQYKTAAAENWSGLTSTGGTTASLTGLSAFTEYLFRVRVKYSGNHYSNFAILRFSTAMELPYDCGFENGMPGWSEVDPFHYYNDYITGIKADARHDGEYGYKFCCYESDPVPQYLISPELPGDKQIAGSFFYRNYANSSPETFQVGYSTSTNDASAFTWVDNITATGTAWQQYQHVFPEGTQYVAVKYTSNLYWLFVDDFEFSAYSTDSKPTDLCVSELGGESVKLQWTAPAGASGFIYQYRPLNGSWSSEASISGTSVTLNNLLANTTYDFRVKAYYDHSSSNYETLRFMTEGPMESLPHSQDFESGMGGWRLENGVAYSGITSNEKHGGDHSFMFDYEDGYDEAQYLRSPRLEGNTSKLVSFYYKNYEYEKDGQPTVVQSFFRVGWSTSSQRISDFEVTPEVAACTAQWKKISVQVPKDTRYVLIELRGGAFWLYVDDVTITELPPITATAATVLGQTQYVATFYDGSLNWQLPDGALAYTVEKEGNDYVFYCIGNVIPAGTAAVILMDKTAQDTGATKEIQLILTATKPTPRPDNVLQGADSQIPVNGGMIGEQKVRVLSISGGTLGFHWFKGSYIPAGKAYILE